MYGLLGWDNIWPRYIFIAFKDVQIRFLAMHIINQKWSFDIFTVINVQKIFMEHDLYFILMIFGIKEKIDNFFDPYNVFLAIATNILQQLKTGFVIKGHTWAVRTDRALYENWRSGACASP